jgi:LysM repeat protein
MAADKQKVLDIALGEVGYLEKASKSSLDDKTANAGSANITKYARDLAEISYFNGNKQGVAWCATFVCWCFYKAYGKAAALKLLCQPTKAANNAAAGCKHARNYFKNKGKLYDTPKAGDQIFFYSSDKSDISHTGLVYKVDSKKVYTVEGNTSSASGVVANGGAVATKSYALTYARIAGYGRPDYGAQVEEVTVKEPEAAKPVDYTGFETYTVKKGDTLWKIAQKTMGSGNQYKAIMTLNQLSSDKLKIGQVLKIKEKADSKEETSSPALVPYTVKKGDTLWEIASDQLGSGKRYKEIMTASGIDSENLKIGQVLKIPKA